MAECENDSVTSKQTRTIPVEGSSNLMDWQEYSTRLERQVLASEKKMLRGMLHITEQRALEIVREANAVINRYTHIRAERRDTAPSAKTLKNYTQKAALIDREMAALGTNTLDALNIVMAKRAAQKQTFFAFKSALKTLKLQRISNMANDILRWQSQGSTSEYWKLHAQRIEPLLQELSEIEKLNRWSLMEDAGEKPKRSKSKRLDLRHMPEYWRERFLELNARFEYYRDAGLLLVRCGLRPQELETGVKVTWETLDTVLVEVTGAKVRETAGQPFRRIRLHASALPGGFAVKLALQGALHINAPADAMRTHLGRLGKILFKDAAKRTQRINLSAYHFRHALVTDLRSSDWEVNEIAALIGETSEKTVSYYGVRQRRGKVQPKETSVIRGKVEVPRAIRTQDAFKPKPVSFKPK